MNMWLGWPSTALQNWRFAFLTDSDRTYFLWRLGEHVYAITDAFRAATPFHGLFTCEMLFCE